MLARISMEARKKHAQLGVCTSIGKYANALITSTALWATIAMFICCYLVSAPMYNKIRSPALYENGPDGPEYIYYPHRGGQYRAESYIVAALNAGVCIGMILGIEAGRKKYRILSLLGVVVVCVTFSCLLRIFKRKSYGYPYRFLFD